MIKALHIRLAKPEDVDAVQAIYTDRGVQGELGEFVMKEGIKNRIAENTKRGSVWLAIAQLDTAPIDGAVIGAANIGSRSAYRHLLRHGEVGVLREFRRQRVGTALYLAQCAQALFEGRRSVEDTIIEDNPNMFRFLPTLEYEVMGVLRERTRAFKSIHLFHHTTYELLWLAIARLPNYRVIIDVVKSWTTRRDFDENMDAYSRYRPGTRSLIAEAVETIESSEFFHVQEMP